MFEGKYIVRALGDSILWGQGLLKDQKFVHRVAKYIALMHGVQDFTYIPAHSGATLMPPPHNTKERRLFADTYRELFAHDTAVQLFLDGSDFTAQNLHHEIPAFFPTVVGQMELVSEPAAQNTDLLLLNGGANDVDFKALLSGKKDISFEELDATIRRVMYESFSDVLRNARRKFDNALIVVVGYYPVFSSDSDRGKIRQAAKKLTGVEDSLLPLAWGAGLAMALTLPWPASHGLLLLGTWGQKEVDEVAYKKVEETIRRAEFIFTRANYWQARAVADSAAIPVHRGPGVIYVHPGFRPENAAFASSVSYLFEDYAPTTDPAREDRMGGHPRSRYFAYFTALDARLKLFFQYLTSGHIGGQALAQTQLYPIKKNLEQLSPGVRAPAALVASVKDALASLRGAQINQADQTVMVGRLKALHEAVRLELSNVGLLEIASLFHPNKEGARQYANAIIAAVKAFVRPDLKDDVRKLSAQIPGGDKLNAGRVLQAYGLDPGTPESDSEQLMQVYSLAVEVQTESQKGLRSVRLVARNGRSWRLDTPLPDVGQNGEKEFVAGATNLFTFDTQGECHLSDLAGLRLELDGEYWNPAKFSLFINGRRLLYHPELSPMRHGEKQELGYPSATKLQPTSQPVG